MNELIPMITERDGIPVTTSRAVAEQFGKNHKNVLQSIENLISQLKNQPATEDFSQLKIEPANTVFAEQNFLQIEQADAQGKPRPAYLLTRDGFTLLAMGFTGAKAIQFKVAYINAFNRMERLIKGGGLPAPALQSIEQRLQALEQTAGEGKTEAYNGVSAIFLQALQAALDSGEYVLNRKGKPERSDTAQLLGIQDRDRTAIPALLAYKIYSEYTPHPLSRPALWGVLEQVGTIRPRSETPQEVDFWGQKLRVIHIDSKSIKERSL